MIESKGIKQNLDRIQVLIEDTAPSSLYFNVQCPDIFPGGKTAISIDPPPSLLKVSSQVKVEIIDTLGNPVYVEYPKDPDVAAYEYGYSSPGSTARLIGITVYPSTPVGYGEIIVTGEAIKIAPNGLPIPPEWKGVYNVRWRKRILLDNNQVNNSQVIFYKTPNVEVAEIQKPYLNQVYSSGKTATISTGTISYDSGYNYAIVTATGFTFTQDMVGGILTVASPQVPYSFAENKYAQYDAYITYIDSLINNTRAYVRNAYVATQKAESGKLSIQDGRKYLAVKHFDNSDFTLSYNVAPSYNTSPNLKAFAKFDITNLDTFSGDVYRLKVFQSSDGTLDGFNAVGEKNLEDTELLFDRDAVDPSSQYMGVFTSASLFNRYWATSSFNFSTNAQTNVYQPTLTFASNTLMNGLVISSSAAWNDNGKVIQFIFPTTQSYFKEGDQLEVRFKLASLTNEGNFDVYASGTAFYQDYRQLEKAWDKGKSGVPLVYDAVYNSQFGLANVNTFGKLVTSFGPDAVGEFKVQKKLYGIISAPIQTDFSGSGSVNIVVRGGEWVVSDMSFVYKRETNFSPSAFSFTIPLEPEQEGDSIAFGVKYYNKLGQEVVIPKIPSPNAPPNMTLAVWDGQQNYGTFGGGVSGRTQTVTGPNTYIDGTRNVMSGSLWIGSQVGHYRYGEIIASGGMELSADAAAGPSGSVGKGVLFRSLGYEGWYRANQGFSAPGFLIWSGSILPQDQIGVTDYSGAGIELWSSGSSLRFDTTTGILEITGSINATSGTIGGWKILQNELLSWPSQNISLSGSGAGYIIARDADLIPRVFFGITPTSQRGSDGWRDPSTVTGLNLMTSGSFEDGAVGPSQWIPGWIVSDNTTVYVEDSASLTPIQGTQYLRVINDAADGLPLQRTAQYLRISSSDGSHTIDSGSTYTLAFWYKGTDSLFSNTIDLDIEVLQELNNWTSSTQHILENIVPSGEWKQYQRAFTTPTSSDGTGSIQVKAYVTTAAKQGDLILDAFTLNGYGYFTDVSQNGLYVFSSPVSYVKLGKDALAAMALNQLTASDARIYGDLDVDGILIGPGKGIALEGAITGAIKWAGGEGTDYYTTYFDHTASSFGSETWWNADDRPGTDYNVYSRIGGGGSAGKNRGWVYADSSILGHVPGIQMVVGVDGELNSFDRAAIYVRGFIKTQNNTFPNEFSKLLITGSIRGATVITPLFQFVDGNQQSGYVLTSNASGVATWQAATGGGGGAAGAWLTSSLNTIYPIPGGYRVAIGKLSASHSLDITGSAAVSGTMYITGSLQYIDGNQQSAYVLTSDASGVATWQAPAASTTLTWVLAQANTTMSANFGYIASGSQVVLCLPTSSATGSVFEVVGKTGSWKITHNSAVASQQMIFGNATASLSFDGFLSSSNAKDSVRLVCALADTEYNVVSSVGNIYIQ